MLHFVRDTSIHYTPKQSFESLEAPPLLHRPVPVKIAVGMHKDLILQSFWWQHLTLRHIITIRLPDPGSIRRAGAAPSAANLPNSIRPIRHVLWRTSGEAD